MRKQANQYEPCTIDAAVVAEYLEQRGMHRMADYVRHQGQLIRWANDREADARQSEREAIERLHKYEPPAPPTPVLRDYRSQWD